MNRIKKLVPGRGQATADWNAVETPEFTDEERAAAHPAKEVLPPDLFEDVTRRQHEKRDVQRSTAKALVSLRLDQDIVDQYKADGPGWQSRMNDELRKTLKKA